MDNQTKIVGTLKILHNIHINENIKLFAMIEKHEKESDVPLLVLKQLKNFIISEKKKAQYLLKSISVLERKLLYEKRNVCNEGNFTTLLKQISDRLKQTIEQYSHELKEYKSLLQKHIDL